VSATSGNSSTQAVLLNAEMSRATAADKLTLGGAINYGRSKADGVTSTTANKWGAAGQYDFNLSAAMFAFGKLGLEGDALTDLSLRSTLAGGLGYKLVNTPELKFTLFGGVGYSTDKYDVAKTIGNKTAKSFSRASLYLAEESEHQLSKTTSFKQRLELYPGVSGDKAMLAKFSAGLGVAMSGTMSLTVGVTDTYNSKPAAGSKKNDLGVFTGINVKFGAL
jgi:putative salt-induced outer membrane protein